MIRPAVVLALLIGALLAPPPAGLVLLGLGFGVVVAVAAVRIVAALRARGDEIESRDLPYGP